MSSRFPRTPRSRSSAPTSIDCARSCSGRYRRSGPSLTACAPRRCEAPSCTRPARRSNSYGGNNPLDFLTDWGVIIALACSGAALVYGLLTSRWLLALSPGNEEMQSISRAVQEGASAYLTRQYRIIGGVAILIAVVLAIAL